MGLVNSETRQTELYPPSWFSGLVVCAVGRIVQNMCVLPRPLLVWNLHPMTGMITVDRAAPSPDAFGDDYCRSIGADIGTRRYTRTFWALDGKGIVAVSERVPGNVLFRWTRKIPNGASVNTSTLGLTFPGRSDVSICVTCIAGAGENILSLATTECRAVTISRLAIPEDPPCDCHLQRFLGAICSLLFITLVSALAYMYLYAKPAPDRVVLLHVGYVRNFPDGECETHSGHTPCRSQVPGYDAPVCM